MPGAGLAYPGTSYPDAEVAELVDALASGASGGIPVEVRVLFSAPEVWCWQGFSGITRTYHATRETPPPLIQAPTGVLTGSNRGPDIAARCRKQKALMSQQRRT